MMQGMEPVHQVEFSESEITQILGTAVKQLIHLANVPSAEEEIATLSKVVEKCSQISSKRRSKKSLTLIKA